MNRYLRDTAIIGGLAATIYIALSLYTPGPLSVATVSVRFSGPCLQLARDGGQDVHQYDRIMVPVEAIRDGGAIDLTFPNASAMLGPDCAVVMDWSTATLDTCANHPGVCDLWDAGFPFVKATRRCVRAPADGGVCLRSNGDGGWRDFGMLNVFPANEAAGSGCEPVECTVLAGENPETAL